MSKTNNRFTLRTLVSMAMLTGVAYVIMLLSKSLPSVNGFLDFDFKDVIICIGGFTFGPMAAAVISVLVSFIEFITVSGTGPIGLAAIQIAKVAGARRVVAIGTSDGKESVCKAYGADSYINAKTCENLAAAVREALGRWGGGWSRTPAP